MTNTNGLETKTLILNPLARTHYIGESQWKQEKIDYDQLINHVLTINTTLSLRSPQEEYTIISNFIQNIYDSPIYFGENHTFSDLEVMEMEGPYGRNFVS